MNKWTGKEERESYDPFVIRCLVDIDYESFDENFYLDNYFLKTRLFLKHTSKFFVCLVNANSKRIFMSSQAESAFTNFPNDLFTPLYFITQILHNFTQLLNSTWRAYIFNSRLNLVSRQVFSRPWKPNKGGL